MAQLLEQGRITEEALADMRRRIGIPLRPRTKYNTTSCYDSVRHFCWGIGDDNPLWLDPDYAAGTRLGRSLAPPSFFYSVTMTVVQMGLRGVHGFHAGTDWHFLAPLVQDEKIDQLIWLDDLREQPSRIGGRSVVTWYSTVYFDARKNVLAHSRSYTFRVERGATRDKNKAQVEPKHWSRDELDAVEAAYAAERARGAEPRYWEDVQVGDPLEPVTKGPLCMTDMMAFYAGAMVAPTPAHRIAYNDYLKHPLWWFRNPENGGLEPMIRVHENLAAARSAGVPAPYDVGVQRQSWLMHLITNWMGDDAFLVRNSAEFRDFNYFGDVHTFSGKVKGKSVDGARHLVELEVWGDNQRGTRTIPGTALVELPTRAPGIAPVQRALANRVSLEAFLATLPNAPKL